MKRSTLYLLTLAFALIFSGQTFSAVSMNSDGWTIVTPSSDSRIVYVSNSEGNDSNNGLSPSTPKKTITAGNALIRDGYPDHLLLRRGDVFPVESSNLLGRWKNGRSAQEPLLFSSYGTSGARPVVKISGYFIELTSRERHYQAIIGIDIYKSNSDPASSDFNNSASSEALRFIGGGNDLLIEDCVTRFVQTTIQSNAGFVFRRPKFRRNIVLDSWGHGSSYAHQGRTQGLYLEGAKESYVIEENFFDHCGWSPVVTGAGANMYNHNVYTQHNNVAGGIMRGNIFARGSGHGLQARSGGLVDRNLFVLNSVAVNVGYHVTPPGDPNAFTFPNRAKENVILNGRRQNVNSSSEPHSAAVWGIWCHANLPGVLVEDNIVANRLESGVNSSYHEVETSTLVNNISYAWSGAWDTTNSSWPHPDHDLGDFYASIGGSNDTIAYLNWLRSRPPGTMPWNMTAYSAINYIRAGFNKSAITGYYNYGGSSSVSVTAVSLSPSSLNIEEGTSSQLTATVSPGNATNPSVNWSSSNTTVATVSSAGLVSAVAAGTATITVTTVDGSFTDQTSVTVTAPSGEDTYNVAEDKPVTASAWQDDSNGYQPPSNLVDGSTGSSTRWSASGYSQWAIIDLEDIYDISEFRLYPYQDRAYHYTIDVSYDGENYATAVDRSSNTQESSVITDAVYTEARYIRLTVTGASGYTGSWISINELEVYGEELIPVTGVSVSPTSLTLDVADTSQLSATVSPSDATYSGVYWCSANSDVATVSNTGLVTAVAAGSTTITVTTFDGSYTDDTSVNVTAPSGGGSGENLLSFDDFSGTSLLDMPTTYTLGTHDADVWMARVGTCGQCSEILTSGSDSFLNTGSGTTNGTFQVVAWPGSGDIEVDFEYRGQPRVRIFGGNTGDQISKFNNSNTLDELGTALMTSSSTWASGYLSLNLNGSYDYLVIQFTNGGDIDNVSAAMEGGAPPSVPVTSVSVSPGSVTLDIEDTSQLTATVSPGNASNPAVSWSSANGNIATVSGNGLVTALAAGTTTITVTTDDGSFTAQTSVTVSPPPSVNLVEFDDFSGSALLDMSTTYTLGTHATDVWMARVGTCGQCSQILGSGDTYLKAGSGTTNGAFQVIQWPGNGTIDVEFDYRNQPRIRIFGGDSGDQVNKFDNVNTLHELGSALMTSSSSWAVGSFSVNLSSSYDYIVIQFTNGGEIDNVSVILE